MKTSSRSKGKQPAPENTGRAKKVLLAGAVFLLLLLGWFYMRMGGDPQMEHVREMQQELFAQRGQLPPEEWSKKREELRAEEEKLTPEQRVELRKEMGKKFLKKMNSSGAQYLAMSLEERQKVVDERIAQQQAWQNGKGGGFGPGGGGPGGPGGGGPGGRGPGGPGGGGPGGPGGGGPGGPGGGGPGGPGGGGPGGRQGGGPPWGGPAASPEERDSKMREFMLQTTPQARAGMDQMRLDTATRRAQLNLPPGGGGFRP